ncbi:putative ubiquitin domain-containing protein [Monocercomonoides exilis]|uniref:putative ubiquitin domain-containing protein n=1 Tax=Monocercomonoides exilis TaxID=2049356 RepID=UPI00355A41C9|nr:putative ubiquitin domain-containing protein [Monocercomonoides exilis]
MVNDPTETWKKLLEYLITLLTYYKTPPSYPSEMWNEIIKKFQDILLVIGECYKLKPQIPQFLEAITSFFGNIFSEFVQDFNEQISDNITTEFDKDIIPIEYLPNSQFQIKMIECLWKIDFYHALIANIQNEFCTSNEENLKVKELTEKLFLLEKICYVIKTEPLKNAGLHEIFNHVQTLVASFNFDALNENSFEYVKTIIIILEECMFKTTTNTTDTRYQMESMLFNVGAQMLKCSKIKTKLKGLEFLTILTRTYDLDLHFPVRPHSEISLQNLKNLVKEIPSFEWDEYNKMQLPSVIERTLALTPTLLSRMVDESNIFDYLFGTDCHNEIATKGKPLLEYLAKNDSLTPQQIIKLYEKMMIQQQNLAASIIRSGISISLMMLSNKGAICSLVRLLLQNEECTRDEGEKPESASCSASSSSSSTTQALPRKDGELGLPYNLFFSFKRQLTQQTMEILGEILIASESHNFTDISQPIFYFIFQVLLGHPCFVVMDGAPSPVIESLKKQWTQHHHTDSAAESQRNASSCFLTLPTISEALINSALFVLDKFCTALTKKERCHDYVNFLYKVLKEEGYPVQALLLMQSISKWTDELKNIYDNSIEKMCLQPLIQYKQNIADQYHFSHCYAKWEAESVFDREDKNERDETPQKKRIAIQTLLPPTDDPQIDEFRFSGLPHHTAVLAIANFIKEMLKNTGYVSDTLIDRLWDSLVRDALSRNERKVGTQFFLDLFSLPFDEESKIFVANIIISKFRLTESYITNTENEDLTHAPISPLFLSEDDFALFRECLKVVKESSETSKDINISARATKYFMKAINCLLDIVIANGGEFDWMQTDASESLSQTQLEWVNSFKTRLTKKVNLCTSSTSSHSNEEAGASLDNTTHFHETCFDSFTSPIQRDAISAEYKQSRSVGELSRNLLCSLASPSNGLENKANFIRTNIITKLIKLLGHINRCIHENADTSSVFPRKYQKNRVENILRLIRELLFAYDSTLNFEKRISFSRCGPVPHFEVSVDVKKYRVISVKVSHLVCVQELRTRIAKELKLTDGVFIRLFIGDKEITLRRELLVQLGVNESTKFVAYRQIPYSLPLINPLTHEQVKLFYPEQLDSVVPVFNENARGLSTDPLNFKEATFCASDFQSHPSVMMKHSHSLLFELMPLSTQIAAIVQDLLCYIQVSEEVTQVLTECNPDTNWADVLGVNSPPKMEYIMKIVLSLLIKSIDTVIDSNDAFANENSLKIASESEHTQPPIMLTLHAPSDGSSSASSSASQKVKQINLRCWRIRFISSGALNAIVNYVVSFVPFVKALPQHSSDTTAINGQLYISLVYSLNVLCMFFFCQIQTTDGLNSMLLRNVLEYPVKSFEPLLSLCNEHAAFAEFSKANFYFFAELLRSTIAVLCHRLLPFPLAIETYAFSPSASSSSSNGFDSDISKNTESARFLEKVKICTSSSAVMSEPFIHLLLSTEYSAFEEKMRNPMTLMSCFNSTSILPSAHPQFSLLDQQSLGEHIDFPLGGDEQEKKFVGLANFLHSFCHTYCDELAPLVSCPAFRPYILALLVAEDQWSRPASESIAMSLTTLTLSEKSASTEISSGLLNLLSLLPIIHKHYQNQSSSYFNVLTSAISLQTMREMPSKLMMRLAIVLSTLIKEWKSIDMHQQRSASNEEYLERLLELLIHIIEIIGYSSLANGNLYLYDSIDIGKLGSRKPYEMLKFIYNTMLMGSTQIDDCSQTPSICASKITSSNSSSASSSASSSSSSSSMISDVSQRHSSFKDLLAPSKRCNDPKTRTAAFTLITTLCLYSKENIRTFVSLCFPVIQKALTHPDLRNTFKYNLPPPLRSSSEYVGLQNPSQICYMNCFLQQLYMHYPFRYSLFTLHPKQASTPPAAETKALPSNHNETALTASATTVAEQNAQVWDQLRSLFASLQESHESKVNMKDFLQHYYLFGKPINVGLQRDVSEFQVELFDKLESHLLASHLPNVLKMYFEGETTNIFHCCHGHVSKKKEVFSLISCDIKQKADLTKSLEVLIQKETLDGDNKWECTECKEHVKATKQTVFSKLPNTLFIHLKRIEFNVTLQKNVKINDRFEFPIEELDMTPYTLDSIMQSEEQYESLPASDRGDNNNNSANQNSSKSSSSLSSQVDAFSKQTDDNNESANSSTKMSYSESSSMSISSESTSESFLRHQMNNEAFPSVNSHVNSNKYVLSGVIVHSGTADGGHYYSLIRERVPPHNWYQFNDSVVSPFVLKDLPSKCFGGSSYFLSEMEIGSAYILVYDRINPVDEWATFTEETMWNDIQSIKGGISKEKNEPEQALANSSQAAVEAASSEQVMAMDEEGVDEQDFEKALQMAIEASRQQSEEQQLPPLTSQPTVEEERAAFHEEFCQMIQNVQKFSLINGPMDEKSQQELIPLENLQPIIQRNFEEVYKSHIFSLKFAQSLHDAYVIVNAKEINRNASNSKIDKNDNRAAQVKFFLDLEDAMINSKFSMDMLKGDEHLVNLAMIWIWLRFLLQVHSRMVDCPFFGKWCKELEVTLTCVPGLTPALLIVLSNQLEDDVNTIRNLKTVSSAPKLSSLVGQIMQLKLVGTPKTEVMRLLFVALGNVHSSMLFQEALSIYANATEHYRSRFNVPVEEETDLYMKKMASSKMAMEKLLMCFLKNTEKAEQLRSASDSEKISFCDKAGVSLMDLELYYSLFTDDKLSSSDSGEDKLSFPIVQNSIGKTAAEKKLNEEMKEEMERPTSAIFILSRFFLLLFELLPGQQPLSEEWISFFILLKDFALLSPFASLLLSALQLPYRCADFYLAASSYYPWFSNFKKKIEPKAMSTFIIRKSGHTELAQAMALAMCACAAGVSAGAPEGWINRAECVCRFLQRENSVPVITAQLQDSESIMFIDDVPSIIPSIDQPFSIVHPASLIPRDLWFLYLALNGKCERILSAAIGFACLRFPEHSQKWMETLLAAAYRICPSNPLVSILLDLLLTFSTVPLTQKNEMAQSSSARYKNAETMSDEEEWIPDYKSMLPYQWWENSYLTKIIKLEEATKKLPEAKKATDSSSTLTLRQAYHISSKYLPNLVYLQDVMELLLSPTFKHSSQNPLSLLINYSSSSSILSDRILQCHSEELSTAASEHSDLAVRDICRQLLEKVKDPSNGEKTVGDVRYILKKYSSAQSLFESFFRLSVIKDGLPFAMVASSAHKEPFTFSPSLLPYEDRKLITQTWQGKEMFQFPSLMFAETPLFKLKPALYNSIPLTKEDLDISLQYKDLITNEQHSNTTSHESLKLDFASYS